MTVTDEGATAVESGNYARALEAYKAAGWRGVLPLPPMAKMPPPRGCTGGEGRWPSRADEVDWSLTFPDDANVALRLPEDVVGLDVDQYGAKVGYDHLLDAMSEHELPPLPPTWRSSARGEPSGILFYRIPPGMRFRGEAVADVETIQHHHRFAIVWPSVHPKERTSYLWWQPGGKLALRVPSPDEFPELPEAWLEFLEDVSPAALVEERPLPAERRESNWAQPVWLAHSRAVLALNKAASGSRHEVVRDAALRLLRLEQGGSAGATAALDSLGAHFVTLVTPDRPSAEEAAAEWRRVVDGGRSLAASTKTLAASVLEDERQAFDDLMGGSGEVADGMATQAAPATQSVADRLRSVLVDSAGIVAMPPPRWLISSYLVRDSLALLYAPSGAGKTFLAVDLAMSVARGAWWNGQAVEAPETVLYVIAEGVAGMGRRLKAWAQHHGAYDLSNGSPVMWLPRAVNLSDPFEAAALAEVAGELAPGLVVIDTLARCTTGAEENSAKDMGIVVDRLDELRRATAATVLVVHHSGKDVSAGARGSSALRAAVDTELELSANDESLSLKVTKQKDAAEAPPRPLVRLPVADSCVLVPAESVRAPEASGDVTQAALEALAVLERIKVPGGIPASVWLKASDCSERSFYRHRSALLDARLVVDVGTPRSARYLPADSLEIEGNSI